MLFKFSEIYLCKLTGVPIDGRLILNKSDDIMGTIWMNIRDQYNTYHQISSVGTNVQMSGGSGFMNFEDFRYSSSFEAIINTFTNKVYYYEGDINDFRSCRAGTIEMKTLPEAYTQKESAIIVGAGVITLLVLYIVFRKYFFKKSKHKR